MNELQLSIVITDKIERNRKQTIDWLRDIAERLIRTLGHGITADELRSIAGIETVKRGTPYRGNNNFMGCVFRDRRFVKSGEEKRSTTKGSHGNRLPVWVLRDTVGNSADRK